MENNVEVKLKELQSRLQLIKAEDIMTRDVITVPEDLSLAQVSDFMIKERISGLPVAKGEDKDKPIGMVTTTDLFGLISMIRSGAATENALNPNVSFAMSSNIISIDKTTTLDQIIDMMKENNIHTVPVFEDGKMVGIVGRRDVFKNFYSVAKSIAEGK